MKIALVTHSFLSILRGVGGAELVIHSLARQWALQGHDVTVFTASPGEAPEGESLYSVRTFNLLRGSTRFGYHRFPFLQLAATTVGKMLKQYNPDFISAHLGYPVAIWLSRLAPVPRFVITCHGREINPKEKPRRVYRLDRVLADALNSSSGVIAISSYGQRLMEEMGVQPSKIHLISNGVDRDRFQKPADFDLRSRFGIPKDAPVILSVGRDNWIKAFDTAIRAFARVHATMPDAYYVMLGKGNDRWLPLVRELGAEGRVIFSELFGDDLIGAYQQADIFFSSSVYEGCPLVLLEAMASGLPAVVTDVSGSQDMVRTGENGIVVQPRRPELMADALSKLLSDRTLRERYSIANHEQSKFYDWSNISRMYLQLA
jgi:glycosyltransferase involved in cell wall biosynthesis